MYIHITFTIQYCNTHHSVLYGGKNMSFIKLKFFHNDTLSFLNLYAMLSLYLSRWNLKHVSCASTIIRKEFITVQQVER